MRTLVIAVMLVAGAAPAVAQHPIAAIPEQTVVTRAGDDEAQVFPQHPSFTAEQRADGQRQLRAQQLRRPSCLCAAGACPPTPDTALCHAFAPMTRIPLAQQATRSSRSWVARHPVLFGTMAGFGAGFLIGYGAGDDGVFSDFTASANGLFLGGIGAAIGAAAGALIGG